jgi:hypothetical protein
MNIQTIKQNYDLLSQAARDTTLRRSGAYHVGPCPFCGGVDRFLIKQTDHGYRWFCRKCGGGKYHSVFNYFMRRDNLSFMEVIESLGGDEYKSRSISLTDPKNTEAASYIPSKDWQARGCSFVASACDRLTNSSEARPVREYLRLRGFEEGIWHRALLGFTYAYDPLLKIERSALCIPHMDVSFNLMAVKFRFVDQVERGLRYTSMKGSKPLFYGLDTLRPSHHTLIIVEGELNQLSIYQLLCRYMQEDHRVSVVSPGSEQLTSLQKTVLPILARNYQRLVVWTDKGEVAGEIQDLLGVNCTLLQSPYGMDANDLLRQGVLGEFLSRIGIVLE